MGTPADLICDTITQFLGETYRKVPSLPFIDSESLDELLEVFNTGKILQDVVNQTQVNDDFAYLIASLIISYHLFIRILKRYDCVTFWPQKDRILQVREIEQSENKEIRSSRMKQRDRIVFMI